MNAENGDRGYTIEIKLFEILPFKWTQLTCTVCNDFSDKTANVINTLILFQKYKKEFF